MINKEKGITLTSLIITIVVMLILAGVSIAVLIGPDGIIGQAQTAAISTKRAEIKERVEMKINNLNIAKISQQEELTLDDIFRLKDNDKEITTAFKEDNSVILVLENKYECKISKALKVENVSEYNPEKLRKVEKDLTFCDFEGKDL